MGVEAQDFTAYGRPLVMVSSFHFLGRTLTTTDKNWTEVVGNLRKARQQWAQLARVLRREGADAQTSGIFFMAVMHATLLVGSEMWVTTPRMVQTLGGIHHCVYRRLMGEIPQSSWTGVIYPPTGR